MRYLYKYEIIIIIIIIIVTIIIIVLFFFCRVGPMIGLLLIALGTGGIKPCVSAFGGDQFSASQVTCISVDPPMKKKDNFRIKNFAKIKYFYNFIFFLF